MFCAKLGVLMASQRHFKQKIFKYIYYSCPHLKAQIPQCSVQNSVFWCLPKGISNRRYSNIFIIPARPSQLKFSKLFLQNRLFWDFPKAFQIEDIQIHTLFLPAPESSGSPSQRHFQQKIFKYIYYSCPHLKAQIPQCSVQNSVFWCLPKGISNRRYSNIFIIPARPSQLKFSKLFLQNRLFWDFPKGVLNKIYSNMSFLHHPWQPRYSPILRAKPAVLRLFQRHFK